VASAGAAYTRSPILLESTSSGGNSQINYGNAGDVVHIAGNSNVVNMTAHNGCNVTTIDGANTSDTFTFNDSSADAIIKLCLLVPQNETGKRPGGCL
jgi:hypothetical protein